MNRVSYPISMNQTFLIREATTSDLSDLLPLVRKFYRHFSYPWNEALKGRTLRELLGNPSLGRVWFVLVGKKRVGYFILSFYFSLEYNGKTSFIDELFLSSEVRGRGIGSAVLKKIVKLCSTLGIKTIQLESEITNPRASALYKRMGFINYGRILMTRRPPARRK